MAIAVSDWSALPPEVRERLRAPLPAEAIKQHPTKSYMSSINGAYILERLNNVFGENGWFAEYPVVEAFKDSAMIVVRCDFTVPKFGIVRMAYGGNDNKDRGDAYKGACTDALGKVASGLGIAAEVYKGMLDEHLTESDNEKRRGGAKTPKRQYENIQGVVTEYQQMDKKTLWLKVNSIRVRAVDEQHIRLLKNCEGKRVELNCYWDAVGKNKIPCMTISGVLGVFEPVPLTHYEQVEGGLGIGDQDVDHGVKVAFKK